MRWLRMIGGAAACLAAIGILLFMGFGFGGCPAKVRQGLTAVVLHGLLG